MSVHTANTPSQAVERGRDVAHLGPIEVRTPELEASVRFYVDQLGLEEVGRGRGRVQLHTWDDHGAVTLVLVGSPELVDRAMTGIQVGVLLPIVMAWQSWFRGELTAARATPAITLSMMANLATMGIVLAAGVAIRPPGVALAAVALTLSSLAETASLWLAARRVTRLTPGPFPAR